VTAIVNLWLIYKVAPVVPEQEMARQPSGIRRIFFFSLFSFTLMLIYMVLYRHHVAELEFRRNTQTEEASDV
jgi:bacteriorhodopsin